MSTNIISVIPIARGISKETLSYFTSAEVKPGSIVEVPLRSKTISGLVISSVPVSDMKSEIKNAPYAIKKVESVKSIDFLPSEFVRAAQRASEYCASTTGAVLSTLISSSILKNMELIEIQHKTSYKREPAEKFVLQADDDDRFAHYRSTIRQEFAKKSSVFFCVPTLEDGKRSLKALEKGIEDYTFLLHGDVSGKKLTDLWNKIHTEEHPVLIIGTGQFLGISRPDISTIILEKENSRGYKVMTRPHMDVRTFVEFYAEESKARLILGDMLLRTETLARYDSGELVEISPLKFRSLSTATTQLIDMRQYRNAEKAVFKIVSDELEQLIISNKEDNEHLFILTTRRGLSSSVVCGDCQNIVMCNECSGPVVLHKSKVSDDKNFFLCHRCGERRNSEELCKTCGSWKLATIGIGIELIEEKLVHRFPDIKVFKIDSDTTKTDKSIAETLASFYSAPGSILLGTEMALHYIGDKIQNGAVISLDSLFALPDFRMSERIFYMLVKMRSLVTKKFILQTRNVEEKILDLALKGNLSDFYRGELATRKMFDYPPFSTLIKITIEGSKDAIVSEMTEIKKRLEPHEIDIFPAFTHTVRGNFVLHGLIKLKPKEWVDKDLLNKLLALPPHITIKVDPESLL